MHRTLTQQLSHSAAALLIPIVCTISCAAADDPDHLRGYLRFSSGDLEPLWDVDDHWSLGLGLDINRYLGAELAFDYYLKDWGKPEPVGEASSYHLVPELRVRYPLFQDRLVPYIVAGIGPSWIQGKDVNTSAFNKGASVESFSFSAAAGAGLEYFIADNVTFDVEGRYLWVNPVDGTINGQAQSVDLSAALFTFGLRIYFDREPPLPVAATHEESIRRLYFGVRAGTDFLTDQHWVPGVRLRPEQAAWGNLASQTGGLLLGADLTPHLGLELAGDHVNHLIEVDGLGPVAEYGQGWVLANLRWRFPLGRWQPYLYAGGGVAYGEFKDFQPAAAGLNFEGDRLHPALNVGGGLEYFIVDNFSLNLDARWAYTWNQGFGIEHYVPRATGDYSYVAATLGFRIYLFNL